MNIQKIKENFSNKKDLLQDELLMLFEDFIYVVSRKGKFDNRFKDFYNYKNYKKLIRILVSKNYCKVSDSLLSQLEDVHLIEIKILNRKAITMMCVGLLFFFLGFVVYNLDFDIRKISLSIIAVLSSAFFFISGLFIFLRGIHIYE
ncbi:hypothetical protein [Flavobacterium sp. 22076]|jgi:hypothetical protein|uniref:hypothetical protein n=1 Tax=unclassified Flavobacterium TaxID=196869 RepID=UPI003F85A776